MIFVCIKLDSFLIGKLLKSAINAQGQNCENTENIFVSFIGLGPGRKINLIITHSQSQFPTEELVFEEVNFFSQLVGLESTLQ